ncbi:hypothetical protein BpHYR1_046364 [Brachionus plicatilis]|uniref:Uncharacterized protein n=1 Tax=Brachionus plicatilis TaxID=10195 RepID=A0A3M7RGY7_BRAPC|nr:hypothetical protein BpHYR1_046364 [Brachionus plicatilis]
MNKPQWSPQQIRENQNKKLKFILDQISLHHIELHILSQSRNVPNWFADGLANLPLVFKNYKSTSLHKKVNTLKKSSKLAEQLDQLGNLLDHLAYPLKQTLAFTQLTRTLLTWSFCSMNALYFCIFWYEQFAIMFSMSCLSSSRVFSSFAPASIVFTLEEKKTNLTTRSRL